MKKRTKTKKYVFLEIYKVKKTRVLVYAKNEEFGDTEIVSLKWKHFSYVPVKSTTGSDRLNSGGSGGGSGSGIGTTEERRVFDWDRDTRMLFEVCDFAYVVKSSTEFLVKTGLSMGRIFVYNRSTEEFAVTDDWVKRLRVLFFISQQKRYILLEYDWKKFIEIDNVGFKDDMRKSHIILSWHVSCPTMYSVNNLLLNLADLGNTNDFGSESLLAYFRMNFTRNFDMILDYLTKYLPIALKLSRYSSYPLRHVFNRKSKTKAFDHIKYANLIKEGGSLVERSGESKGDVEKMKYDKLYLSGGIDWVMDIPIFVYDYASFFGSVFMVLFGDDEGDNALRRKLGITKPKKTFSTTLHAKILGEILGLKKNAPDRETRACMKLLANAGGFGGIKNKYSWFAPSKWVAELITSTGKMILESFVNECKKRIPSFTLFQANTDSVMFSFIEGEEEGEEEEEEGEEDGEKKMEDEGEELNEELEEFEKIKGEYESKHLKLKNEGNRYMNSFFKSSMTYPLQRGAVFNPQTDKAKGRMWIGASVPLVIRRFNFHIASIRLTNGAITEREVFGLYRKHFEDLREQIRNKQVGYSEFCYTKGYIIKDVLKKLVVDVEDGSRVRSVPLDKAIVNRYDICIRKVRNDYVSEIMSWWF